MYVCIYIYIYIYIYILKIFCFPPPPLTGVSHCGTSCGWISRYPHHHKDHLKSFFPLFFPCGVVPNKPSLSYYNSSGFLL